MTDETGSNETPEERRKRRIEEARAKLAAQKAAAEAEPVEPPTAAAAPPADETVDEKRKRRIEEARAKLAAQKAAAEAEPAEPPAAAAPPADESVEEKRKRRIEEARAKLAAQKAVAEAEPAAPPADETVDEKRKRRIEEARAKVAAQKSAGGVEPPATAVPPTPAPASAAKKARAGVEVEDASDDKLVRAVRATFDGAVETAVRMVGQRIVTIAKVWMTDVHTFLRDDPAAGFDLLLDVTAVHRPDEDPPFEVVYQLASTRTFERVRIKVRLGDGESIASVAGIWPTANWLERECYDMFGIVFEGHPDLRRILLPEGWEGHPLRKEYPVEFRENAWVREHLNIVELPADADFSGKFEV